MFWKCTSSGKVSAAFLAEFRIGESYMLLAVEAGQSLAWGPGGASCRYPKNSPYNSPLTKLRGIQECKELVLVSEVWHCVGEELGVEG